METKQFTSSQVSSGSYNLDKKELIIAFSTGKRYAYFNVPEKVWEDLKLADSAGKYLNANVKGKYAYKQLQEK